jgi:xanthine dehydrogenase accessory factor
VESADQEVLRALVDWPASQSVDLFTVARTWGSSPRPPGSLLAIREDGLQAGSVSGGCVEEDLARRVAGGEFAGGGPRLISYGVATDQARRFGLPCGGQLDLVAERIGAREPWRRLLGALQERRCLARRICLGTGEASLHPVAPDARFGFDGENLIKVFGPQWQLLIIGANQVARYLVPIARSLDYRVVVCDPRQEQAGYWDLADAELDRGMPDDVVRARADDPRSAVVALTHDPKLDDMALMEALTTQAFYVGALGSRSSSEKRRQRLLQLDVPAESLVRLRAPVGLPIGGRTPPEIAVSIAADLTATRHDRHLQSGGAALRTSADARS